MSYGRYFEEFNVGDVYKHWPGRTITEHDDTWFSLMTMNQNPLDIDEHYAAGTQHGRRLVNGTLIFSLAVGMSVADVSGKCIANLEYEYIRHLSPTFHGDTIYAAVGLALRFAFVEHFGLGVYRRSEEHTSELQSRPHLVCRHLLEKKNKQVHHENRTSERMSVKNKELIKNTY